MRFAFLSAFRWLYYNKKTPLRQGVKKDIFKAKRMRKRVVAGTGPCYDNGVVVTWLHPPVTRIFIIKKRRHQGTAYTGYANIHIIINNDHFRGFVTKNDKIFENYFWMEDYEAERGFLTMKGANGEKKKCKRKKPRGERILASGLGVYRFVRVGQ